VNISKAEWKDISITFKEKKKEKLFLTHIQRRKHFTRREKDEEMSY
jgi:hypothetical protein